MSHVSSGPERNLLGQFVGDLLPYDFESLTSELGGYSVWGARQPLQRLHSPNVVQNLGQGRGRTAEKKNDVFEFDKL